MSTPTGPRPTATAVPPPGAPPIGSTAPAPDLPPVPRAHMSRFSKVILGFGVLVIGGYVVASTSGWAPGRAQKEEMPASVRSSQGGYRSFHFWHSGYHGGK